MRSNWKKLVPLFLGGMAFVWTGSDAFAESALDLIKPLTLVGGNSGDVKYRDKMSGDQAFAAGDFSVAASFYAKYRERAADAGDRASMQDAFEREIDALLLAGLPSPAEKALNDYERSFHGLNSLSVGLWRADIRLLQRNADAAEKYLTGILPSLSTKDPRRLRAISALAFVHELKHDYAAAAKLYSELAALGADRKLGRAGAEREIMALISAGNLDEAMTKLSGMPVPKDPRNLFAFRCLNFYYLLKKGQQNSVADAAGPDKKSTDVTPAKKEESLTAGSEPPAAWADLIALASDAYHDDFFYLFYTLCAENFERQSWYPAAVEAYQWAFQSAAVKQDQFDTLTRMIQVLEKQLDKKDAGRLAWEQYRLFNGSSATVAMKLRYARLLAESGMQDKSLTIYRSLFADSKMSSAERESCFLTAFHLLLKMSEFQAARELTISYFGEKDTSPEKNFYCADILLQEKKFKEAGELYISAANSAVSKPVIWRDSMTHAVNCFYELHEYAKVVELANALIEKNPADPILLLRASSYEQLKETEKAQADYLTYAKLDKTSAPDQFKAQALYRAARLYLLNSNVRESIPLYRQVFKQYPGSEYAPPAGYWLICACYMIDDEQNAEKETWAMTETFPESEYTFLAQLKLAAYFMRMGGLNRAEATIEQLVRQEKYPKIRARAFYEKALIAYRRKSPQMAEETIRQFEALFPDDPNLSNAYYLRGDILKDARKYQEAASVYQEAARRRPGDILEQAAYGSAGDCYAAQAALSESEAMYKLAIESYSRILNMKEPLREYQVLALYKAGRCLQMIGDDAAAFENFRKLLYLCPATEAKDHALEALWCVKAVEALCQIAAKNPLPEHISAAVYGLNWLHEAGIQNSDVVRKRIRQLRKKQYRPIIQEIHNK